MPFDVSSRDSWPPEEQLGARFQLHRCSSLVEDVAQAIGNRRADAHDGGVWLHGEHGVADGGLGWPIPIDNLARHLETAGRGRHVARQHVALTS